MALGVELDKEAVRERIYGMPYAEFKTKHQGKATEEQLVRMNESVAKNKT